MKIALLTITWRRPRTLGRLIECFLRQTYPNREMIILDDADDYPTQPCGDRWKLVSIDRRFCSLGAKRNACAALASLDADVFLICDDDDILLPWAMAATAHAIQRSQSGWVQPRQAYQPHPNHPDRLIRCETFGRNRPHYVDYHSGWSYRRDVFEDMRGYPLAGEDDTPVRDHLVLVKGPSGDTICTKFPDPIVIYSGDTRNARISQLYQKHRESGDMAKKAWDESGRAPVDGQFSIEWDRDYTANLPTTLQERPW
jgi:glycosyltransferase involved in cell wall biosynthesis